MPASGCVRKILVSSDRMTKTTCVWPCVNRGKDLPASFHYKVFTYFGIYEANDKRTLHKECTICQSCFAKVKYNRNTTDLQSHLVCDIFIYVINFLCSDCKMGPSLHKASCNWLFNFIKHFPSLHDTLWHFNVSSCPVLERQCKKVRHVFLYIVLNFGINAWSLTFSLL